MTSPLPRAAQKFAKSYANLLLPFCAIPTALDLDANFVYHRVPPSSPISHKSPSEYFSSHL